MKKYFAALAATLSLAPAAAFAQDAAPAPAPDFAGPRVEARLGYETPTVSDGSGGIWKIGSAVSYGGELGFDVRAGKRVVIGPYVNYEVSSVSLCDGGDCLDENGNLSAGARLGVVVGGRTLIYAKAGYARISFDASSGNFTDSAHKDGVQGALGVDFGVSKNVYVFVEGSYADYGDFYGINLQRRHVAGGIGLSF